MHVERREHVPALGHVDQPQRGELLEVRASGSRHRRTSRCRWCGTSPEMARSVDVFPAPFGPISATTSPIFTSTSMPRTASTGPYETSSPRISSIESVDLRDAEVGVDDPLVLEHRGGVADGDEVTQLEHRDPVAEPRDEVELVVDDEERHALVAEVYEIPREVLGLRRVEARRRLVEQQDAAAPPRSPAPARAAVVGRR